MGLSMLVSLVSLEYGSMSGERAPLALFLILRYLWFPFFSLQKFDSLLSLATIAGYWLWFLYLKYLKMESEASKEVSLKIKNAESYPLFNHATVCKPSDTLSHAMSELILLSDVISFSKIYCFQNTQILSHDQ